MPALCEGTAATGGRALNRGGPRHSPDPEVPFRCVCGAEIVWFEGAGSDNLSHGYGCSALGWPTRAFSGYKED